MLIIVFRRFFYRLLKICMFSKHLHKTYASLWGAAAITWATNPGTSQYRGQSLSQVGFFLVLVPQRTECACRSPAHGDRTGTGLKRRWQKDTELYTVLHASCLQMTATLYHHCTLANDAIDDITQQKEEEMPDLKIQLEIIQEMRSFTFIGLFDLVWSSWCLIYVDSGVNAC